MSLFNTMHASSLIRRAGAAALLSVATVATVASADVLAQSARPKSIMADAIIVVVNDEVITRNELDLRVRSIEARMKAQNQKVPPYSELRKQVLERMIVDRAALQVAKETGIRVDDNLLDRYVARIAEQNKMTMQQFRDQVERDGLSFPAFREEIRDDITMQRIREREVDNKIQISQAEIDHYLETEATGISEQTELNLGQILVRVPENATPEQTAIKRTRAEEAMRMLRSGADFAQIAATYSDASDALKGGEMGYKVKDRLPELFVEAVSKLKAGQVSQIIKSPNGFHIIKLIDSRTSTIKKDNPLKDAVQQTRARHILLRVNQITTAADASKKINELKERLKNKAATFEELAKLHSVDGSASRGGDLGWLYPGDTAPEFERAMDALKVGELSEPIESPFGMHLIQVTERKTDDVSKERQRLLVRQILRDRKLEEATQDWLRQVRDRAYVETREDR